MRRNLRLKSLPRALGFRWPLADVSD